MLLFWTRGSIENLKIHNEDSLHAKESVLTQNEYEKSTLKQLFKRCIHFSAFTACSILLSAIALILLVSNYYFDGVLYLSTSVNEVLFRYIFIYSDNSTR